MQGRWAQPHRSCVGAPVAVGRQPAAGLEPADGELRAAPEVPGEDGKGVPMRASVSSPPPPHQTRDTGLGPARSCVCHSCVTEGGRGTETRTRRRARRAARKLRVPESVAARPRPGPRPLQTGHGQHHCRGRPRAAHGQQPPRARHGRSFAVLGCGEQPPPGVRLCLRALPCAQVQHCVSPRHAWGETAAWLRGQGAPPCTSPPGGTTTATAGALQFLKSLNARACHTCAL